jgi:16S rRNA C967 or C1407 C5-methylase (RsmB/RsmF family)/NOL1/NOP2/fmu family ribosome biogenesis protein
MFPEEFIERILSQNQIDPSSLLRSLEEPSPVSIRLNPGKWNRIPTGSEKVPWCNTGFYLESRPSFTLDPLFHAGCYFPREASGMFLEQVFEQIAVNTEDIRILDLCAAPGGKSTQLSDLIGKDSVLISNEVIKSRSVVLAETLTKWGNGNTVVTQNDPSAFTKLKSYFDIIVIDAPCSGEGMFRDKTAVDQWSMGNAKLCQERQRRIIGDVWPSLKENGLLVYSTCTFNPGENEENIKWLTENHRAECLRLDIKDFKGIEEIDYRGIYGYGFYPDRIRGEGFFISVIRKVESEALFQNRIPVKNQFRPDKIELSVCESWISTRPEKILKRGEELINLPLLTDEFIFLFKNLNIIAGGTLIATRKKNDFLPSAALALSQDIRKYAFPSTEIDYETAIAFLRRDNIAINDLPAGWNLLTFKGVNLGFVKNIGKRINNYFPVEWRIRMERKDIGSNIINWNDEQQ